MYHLLLAFYFLFIQHLPYRAKLALKTLQMVVGSNLPDDVASFVEKVCPQGLQKPADVTFTVHQQKQQEKKLDWKFMKRLDNLDKEVVPPKMNTQYYHNNATSWLKNQYGTVFNDFFCCSLMLTCFRPGDRPEYG